jgi:hypothetical protein
MIILKGVLAGIGLSVAGTIAYVVLLWWSGYRETRALYPTGAIGFDITSLKHILTGPVYYLFILGWMAVGIATVLLWPRAVPTPQ